MSKKARLAAELAAAQEAAARAAEHGSSTLDDVVGYVVPRAVHAKDQAAAVVGPAFEGAKERIVPLVNDVVDKVTPAVQSAYETVSDKVERDVYPWIQERLDEAGEDPRVIEATRRSRSALAAIKGDLLLPDPEPVIVIRKRHGVLRTILAGVGLAALIAAVVVAVRTVLGTSDDGWSPQEPMEPAQDTDDEWGDSPFDDVKTEPDVDTTTPTSDEQAAEAMDAEGGAQADDAPSAGSYGEGAYVGSEPPEGYTIKGNERSMKYHTSSAAGYERTNADVWFNSEEAAQAAGFTRALR
ncbi:hypothetical protein GCM10009785_18720 [Brooklawnia cerclae]|uniref:Uncharacterized protein n=1 Tax=Brooklawnia cerclae TaxID=349934 RepID=A0ABX0SKI0_9ACTN|nr:hypothetical protein [Brooklawnia cerclae]NIH57555.1 hypothetical protein [Brooklawnia cerclae]